MTSRILPVLLILVAVGLFFAYVNPTYSEKVTALRSEIRGYDAALLAAKKYHEKEAQLIAERQRLPAEELERLESFLPDGVDNVQLILDMNALADRSGVELSDFDIVVNGEPKGTGGSLSLESESPIDSLDLTVTAVGTYANFKTFLAGTEQSLRLLDLVSLDIDDSTTGVYGYKMTFRLYWLR